MSPADPPPETPAPPYGRGEVWWPSTPLRVDDLDSTIDVLIPAFNEQTSLPSVLKSIPDDWVRRVVVVDNGSTDDTAAVARSHGADVVPEPNRGYGAACLAGIRTLDEAPPDIVCFIDGDFSDDPSQLPRVVRPIVQDDVELVIGSRSVGARETGALEPQSRFGNWLACLLLEAMHGYRFTDLGPFRAIRWSALRALNMRDEDFGWTVEMQMKAARQKMRCVEVPVDYRRRRAGTSKISGTIDGSLRAGAKILWTLGKGLLQAKSDS